MTKRKVSAKKGSDKTPFHAEVADMAAELEAVAHALRTSTVTLTRERILQLAVRLKSLVPSPGDDTKP